MGADRARVRHRGGTAAQTAIGLVAVQPLLLGALAIAESLTRTPACDRRRSADRPRDRVAAAPAAGRAGHARAAPRGRTARARPARGRLVAVVVAAPLVPSFGLDPPGAENAAFSLVVLGIVIAATRGRSSFRPSGSCRRERRVSRRPVGCGRPAGRRSNSRCCSTCSSSSPSPPPSAPRSMSTSGAATPGFCGRFVTDVVDRIPVCSVGRPSAVARLPAARARRAARSLRERAADRPLVLSPAAAVFLLVVAGVGPPSVLASPSYLAGSRSGFFGARRARSAYYVALYLFWVALLPAHCR